MFLLRAATGGDAEAISSILIRARAALLPYARSTHSEADLRAWVQSSLVPSGGVTVVESECTLVGMVATSSAGGYSWVDQLSVDHEHRGRGIGGALLSHALAALRPPVRLYTFQANAAARGFYERHGFVALEFTDGRGNEERCPDVLYEWSGSLQAER